MYYFIIINILLIFYAYIGYPLILKLFILLGIQRKNRIQTGISSEFPLVSIIIAAFNEESVIEKKIENTLSLNSINLNSPEIIVASDCSNDQTHELVYKYENQGVKLISLTQRQGKEFAQLEALKQAKGEIIIFTDSKIMLNKDALLNFLKYFKDSKVGSVSSVDKIISENEESSGEGFYIKYEMLLRNLESDFHSLVGLSGSCFAVRREIALDIKPDIPSDFSLLLEGIKKGYIGVIANDVIGSYYAVKSEKAEFKRKVRTVLRGITTFFKRIEVINPFKYGVFSWQIVSHKLCRWLVPFSMLFIYFGCGLLYREYIFFIIFIASNIISILAIIGFYFSSLRSMLIFKIPLFFVLVNYGILVAWINFFIGKRFVNWTPSNKG